MNLSDYIVQIGDEEFARKFGVTPRAASAYRLGERRPRFPIAQRIVKGSPVTWAGIHEQEPQEQRT